MVVSKSTDWGSIPHPPVGESREVTQLGGYLSQGIEQFHGKLSIATEKL